jgi:hypothetical protein
MTYSFEDYLVRLHTGQWFGWSDYKNKTYDNLIIHSDDAKPTEQECIDGIATLQTEYDSLAYARSRKAEYDQLNQFEMQFDDNRDGTTTWVDSINEIKSQFPKG